MHDVCDVERRDFRSGVRIWRRPTYLGRVFGRKDWGATRGGREEKGVDRMATRVSEGGFRAEARRRTGGRHVVEGVRFRCYIGRGVLHRVHTLPFGLTNAPATSQRMANHYYRPLQTPNHLASGVTFPIDFKNGTDGSATVAVDAMRSSSNPLEHSFQAHQ